MYSREVTESDSEIVSVSKVTRRSTFDFTSSPGEIDRMQVQVPVASSEAGPSVIVGYSARKGISCVSRSSQTKTRLLCVYSFELSMSSRKKRSLSPQQASGSHGPRKRAYLPPQSDIEPSVIDVDADDLPEILARIKDQEENESLAKQLDEQWNGVAGPSNSGQDDDDEALARRLAAEWEQEDGAPMDGLLNTGISQRQIDDEVIEIEDDEDDAFPVPSTSTAHPQASTSHTAKRTRPPPRRQGQSSSNGASQTTVPPDEKLEDFRALFTSERPCSKCGEPVASPRGYVCELQSNVPS